MAVAKKVKKCKDCPALPLPPANRADRVPGVRYRPKKDLDAPFPGPRCYFCNKARERKVKASAHARYIEKTYNITYEFYLALYDLQGGKCYVCVRATGESKKLAVDHDHKCCPGSTSCGECVRGLLCKPCNQDVLGHLRDEIAAFERGISYLKNPPAERLRMVS